MEILIVVIVIGMLVWMRNSLSSDLNSLYKEIRHLREDMQKLQQKRDAPPAAKPAEPPPAYTPPPSPVPDLAFIKQEIIPEKEIPVKEEVFETITKEIPDATPKAQEVFNEIKPPPVFNKKVFTPPTPKPSFFEKHPDLEKFIGENLINKIGIGILVLGIAFFVKYAIDQNWINEIGRVCIGILAGGILIGIAHRMRQTFKAFSSVLVGGGLAVLYFTIAISFHEYHIFGQTPAFVIMVIITAFAVLLAFAYDRIELAVLALIGGFGTPFMLSTGEGNYKVLFTYLLILNGGMLALAFKKKWNLVNILCFAFTILIYGTWLATKCLNEPNAPYLGALLFGTAFYLVFFLANIIYNIRKEVVFKAQEIAMLLSNTALYYAAGMGILYYIDHAAYQGLFTVAMGVFNFGFAFVLYKRQTVDRNLVFLLIGLVLTFISLAAPVQLQGNHITLFWAAEAVLLLWFSQRSGITLVKGTSIAVTFLMILSLLMDWTKLYMDNTTVVLPLFLNKGFITGFVSFVSVFLTLKLLKNEKETYFAFKEFSLNVYTVSLQVVFVALLYLTFLLEINYQLMQAHVGFAARSIGLGIYNFGFITIAYSILRKKIIPPMAAAFMIFSSILIILYLVHYNNSVIHVRAEYLIEKVNGLFFILHFVLATLFCAGIFIFNKTTKNALYGRKEIPWLKWATVFLITYIGSAELNHIIVWMSYSPGRYIDGITHQVNKAGYSVLWGIISFVLMQQGMKRKDRMLRVISLSLFFITILKLFLYDIRDISEAGKIVAFISLGVLLLVVSFMYQRLKKLILEDDAKHSSASIAPDENTEPTL